MESHGSLSHSVKSTLRNLGVHMGQAFSLDQHVNYLVRNCFYQLRNIAKLRPVVSTAELEMIIHAFIPPALIIATLFLPVLVIQHSNVYKWFKIMSLSF